MGEFYRCFAAGSRMGRNVSDGAGRFLPYIPAWCPLMQEKEAESNNDYTVYWGDVPVTPGKLPEITLLSDAPELGSAPIGQSMEFTMHIKTPKRWRCGSRKRLVKLLMSEGIGRRYAERLADFTRTLMPYGEAWRSYLLHELWKG